MWQFLKNVYSPGNLASFSRFGAQQALLASIIWITVLVYRLNDMDKLGNIGMFVAACGAFVVAIYGMGKVNETRQLKNGGADNLTPPPAPGADQAGFTRIGVLAMIIALALTVSFAFYGCGKTLPIGPAPVETVTKSEEPVKETEPIADLKKNDLPVGADPDKTVLIEQPHSDGTVEKTWLELDKPHIWSKPKIKVYQNKAASSPTPGPRTPDPAPVSVHTMAPSHFWRNMFIIVVIVIIVFFAARRYIPLFGALADGIDAAAKPLISEVAHEAGEASAHALQEVKSLRQKICEKMKSLLSRTGGK